MSEYEALVTVHDALAEKVNAGDFDGDPEGYDKAMSALALLELGALYHPDRPIEAEDFD